MHSEETGGECTDGCNILWCAFKKDEWMEGWVEEWMDNILMVESRW